MSQKKNPTAPISEKMLLTAKEMSKVSGIGENTLRHLMDIGELEYIQVGSHRRIRLKRVVKDFLILFTEYSKFRQSKSRGPHGSRPAHAPLTRQPSSGGLPRGAYA